MVLSFLVGGTLLAQKPAELDHVIQFAGSISEAQEKIIHEALHGLDPSIEVWIDRPTFTATTRGHLHLVLDDLELAFLGSGLTVAPEGLILLHTTEGLASYSVLPDDFPVLIPTDDPEVDQATYSAAKQAWVEAHPALYEQLQRSDHPTTVTPADQ